MVAGRLAILLLVVAGAVSGQTPWQIDRWQTERTAEPPWTTIRDIEMFVPPAPQHEIPIASAWSGLDPIFADRVRRAFERAGNAGLEPQLTSAWRPRWHNEVLRFRQSQRAGATVVPPGLFSPHIGGRAVDIFITRWERIDEWIQILREEGLYIPVRNDYVHVEAIPPVRGEIPGASTLFVDLRLLSETELPNFGVMCAPSFCGDRRFGYPFIPTRTAPQPISVEAARVLSEYQRAADERAAARQKELDRQEQEAERSRRDREEEKQMRLEKKELNNTHTARSCRWSFACVCTGDTDCDCNWYCD